MVDARSGPGIKSLVKSKKSQKEPITSRNSNSRDNENDTPEKINKKHFYRSKKKPAVVRKRNPSIPVSGFLDMSRWTKEKVCCGIIFRGPHGEVAIDPRFMNPCHSCKSIKAQEPLAPIISSNEDNNSTSTTSTTTENSISKNTNNNSAESTSDVAVDDMETDTDSSSTISGSGPDLPMSSSSAAATALVHHHNKLVDGEDDEGFFDKPAVSPSESGTSTPPPSSDPEIAPHDYIRDDMVNTT